MIIYVPKVALSCGYFSQISYTLESGGGGGGGEGGITSSHLPYSNNEKLYVLLWYGYNMKVPYTINALWLSKHCITHILLNLIMHIVFFMMKNVYV